MTLQHVSIWMPILGGAIQIAAGLYVGVVTRRGIRLDKESREVMRQAMLSIDSNLAELVQLYERVEILERAVFGDRR